MDQTIKKILGMTGEEPAREQSEAITDAYRKSIRLGIPVNSEDPMVLEFHRKAIAAIFEEQSDAVKACSAESLQQLRSDIRLARIAGIMKLAAASLEKRLKELARPVQAKVDKARALIDKAMNREPGEPMAKLFWFARVTDARMQLAGLDMQGRMKAGQRLADMGHEIFPELFLNALVPPVPEELVKELTARYQVACAGEQVKLLEEGEEGLDTINAVANNAWLAIHAGCSGLGIPLKDLEAIGLPEIVKAWPGPTKNRFIAENGEAAYTQLLEGRGHISALVSFFRPGLK